MRKQMYVRCENGHGQQVIFGSPPGHPKGVDVIATKGGTHPIYISKAFNSDEEHNAFVEQYAKLNSVMESVRCGLCGGKLTYEVVDDA